MDFKCKKCGNIWTTTPTSIIQGTGCPCCAKNKPYTTEDFKNKLSKILPFITILSDYTNNHTKIMCKCDKCGKIFSKLPTSLLNGYGCSYCSIHKFRNHDEFVKDMKEVNPTIKIIGEFINTKEKILVKCKVCGKEWLSTPNMLLQGNGCRDCYIVNNKGENHPNWNPNLTNEERIIGRRYPGYIDWTKKVLKKDNYTCQISGQVGGQLCVHHLDGYNWCIDKRLDINNGITLSKKIHNEFHSLYGKGNNTIKQFIDFVERKYNQNQLDKNKYELLTKRLYEIKGDIKL